MDSSQVERLKEIFNSDDKELLWESFNGDGFFVVSDLDDKDVYFTDGSNVNLKDCKLHSFFESRRVTLP
jgi:hypothetical protein